MSAIPVRTRDGLIDTKEREATMRPFLCLLGFLSTLPLAACSGGSSNSPATEAGDPASGDARACDVPTWGSSTGYNAYTSTGSAHLTKNGVTTELLGLRCETLRGEDGAVTGYAASFADAVPEPTITSAVLVYDGYSGDGTYEGYVSHWAPEGFASIGATVTISDDGRSGVAENEEEAYRLEFECDDSDDTTVAPRTAPEAPAPGTAQVVDARGELFVFEGITCSYDEFSDQLTAEIHESRDQAYMFRALIDAGMPGENRADITYNYFGISNAGWIDGDAELACTDGVSGTFVEDAGYIVATFTCPSE